MKKDIYIFNNGDLMRKNDTLLLETSEGKRYIPVSDVGAVHCFGEVNMNKSLLEFATKNQLTIHFYNYYEYYVGSYYPREHLNSGFVTLSQCEVYLDASRRRQLASCFVDAASRNILQILKYYDRRGRELSEEITLIEDLAASLEKQGSIPEVMAVEGNIRQIYYQCFNKILSNDDFLFSIRSRRPPKDRINSLISFGNSILYNVVLSQIYHTQLDPRIAYLHSTNERRFSLNLDVAEIFKPVLVDRTIFTVINKGILTKNSFSAELGGIILKESGRKSFVQELNEKLDTTIQLPNIGHRVSYKQLIRMELYKLQKHFTEGAPYVSFVAKW